MFVYLIKTKLLFFSRLNPTYKRFSSHFFPPILNLLLFIFQALAQLQLIDYIGEQTALLIKVSFSLLILSLKLSLRAP